MQVNEAALFLGVVKIGYFLLLPIPLHFLGLLCARAVVLSCVSWYLCGLDGCTGEKIVVFSVPELAFKLSIL